MPFDSAKTGASQKAPAPATLTALYSTLLTIDPTGPDTGLNRIVRGGSWKSPPNASRSATRSQEIPESFADDLGFRIVLDTP